MGKFSKEFITKICESNNNQNHRDCFFADDKTVKTSETDLSVNHDNYLYFQLAGFDLI